MSDIESFDIEPLWKRAAKATLALAGGATLLAAGAGMIGVGGATALISYALANAVTTMTSASVGIGILGSFVMAEGVNALSQVRDVYRDEPYRTLAEKYHPLAPGISPF